MASVVLVPPDIIRNTPSRRDSITYDVEHEQRIYGCQLILKAGVLLELEAVPIASGQIIFHRFYYRQSLKAFDVRRMAAAALWLACKLEEFPRAIQHVINVFNFLKVCEEIGCDPRDIAHKEYVLDNTGEEYKMEKGILFRYERCILRELGFMVSQLLVHPHRYILQYIHTLFKGNYFLHTNELSQRAWGYLNDSMCTTLCCEVQPAVVAVASIYLAACDIDLHLSKDSCWFEIFDVRWIDIVRVSSAILRLYQQIKPKYAMLADFEADKKEVIKDRIKEKEKKKSRNAPKTTEKTEQHPEKIPESRNKS